MSSHPCASYLTCKLKGPSLSIGIGISAGDGEGIRCTGGEEGVACAGSVCGGDIDAFELSSPVRLIDG